MRTAKTMLDRATALSATAEGTATTTLARRRALFAILVTATMAATLWLAMVAVPPYSAGGIAFLVLFTVTLPWSVLGFCCLLYTSPSPRDGLLSRMPSSA